GAQGVGRVLRSNGLRGVREGGLSPSPENGNPVMLVGRIGTKPATRSRATAVASRAAGGAWRSAIEPAVVTSPATSNRSLIETGIPAKREGVAPLLRCAS